MAKDPTFPFYAQDYLVDTLRWSRGMKSLHVDLLAESWINGGLEDENGHPAGLEGEDLTLWERIRHKWKLTSGLWINEKLEETRARRGAFRNKQSEVGKKGGRPKKGSVIENKAIPFEEENPKETQPFLNPFENDKGFKTLLENEYEKEIESKEEGGTGEEAAPQATYLVPAMLVEWKKHLPAYPEDRHKDFPALQSIAEFICTQVKTSYDPRDGDIFEAVMSEWAKWAAFIAKHNFFKNHSLTQIDRHSQSILQSLTNGQTGNDNKHSNGTKPPSNAERLATARAALADRFNSKIAAYRPAGESSVPGEA